MFCIQCLVLQRLDIQLMVIQFWLCDVWLSVWTLTFEIQCLDLQHWTPNVWISNFWFSNVLLINFACSNIFVFSLQNGKPYQTVLQNFYSRKFGRFSILPKKMENTANTNTKVGKMKNYIKHHVGMKNCPIELLKIDAMADELRRRGRVRVINKSFHLPFALLVAVGLRVVRERRDFVDRRGNSLSRPQRPLYVLLHFVGDLLQRESDARSRR